MDASKPTEIAAIKCLENNGKEFYEVPAHLVEWKERPNERRVLIVKNENGTHYRKYKPGENDTTYFCWSCYINYGLRIEATYLNGIVKAPLRHACDLIQLTINEKIKLETNDEFNGNPSSSTSFPFTSSTSATKSNVLVLENPCKNISSNPVADDDPDRPLSRESDVIFIENDEIKPDYKDPLKTLTEKLQAFKRKGDYRTVAPTEYEEAYSAGGYKGNRIIVFEENDKSRVQQYAGNNNNYWYCLGCFRSKRKHTQAFREKDKTFLVPKEHFCAPISYKKVKEEQQKIVKRLKINEVNGGSAGNGDVNDEESDASHETLSPPSEVNSIRSRLRSRSPVTQIFSPSSSVKEKEKPLQVKKHLGRKKRAAPPLVSTHGKRDVIEGGYVRGVGARNQTNGRIFVFVEADHSLCHEYRRSKENSYYCRGCYALDKSKKRFAIMGNNKIFRVPFLDEHVCQPFDYAAIQEEQKAIKEKYAPKTTTKQSKSANQISTSATSSSSKTAPLQSAPLLSGPRLRSRTRTPVDSPASAVSTSSKLPINQRERTPYPSSILQRKRKAERQNDADSEATKKSKPIEGELESQDSDKIIEKPKANSAKTFQYSRIVKDNTFKRNMLNAANATYRNGSQIMENSSTPSTPVDRSPSIRQNVLYTSKSPPTCVPKPSNTSLIKGFTTISSTPLPPISTSATPLPPPPTPPSTVPTPSPISASSKIILSIPSLPNLLSTTPTPSATSTPLTTPSNSTSTTTTVKFYKPSQYFLEKCCKKLDMDYTDQVYKFWFNISIHQVSPSAIPNKIYPTDESKYHGFECLSLYLTGAEDKATYIREKINEHMYNENTRNSPAANRHIEGVALFSSVITGPHLALIASWLECRIGIFAEGSWKRYGNWDATDADIPILLMELKNGKYSPILTLK